VSSTENEAQRDRYLLMVRTDVDADTEGRFNEWYATHVPTLMAVPGFRWGRRYHLVEGDPTEPAPPGVQRYVAIYGIDHPDVLRSAPYEAVRAWDSAIKPHLRNTVVALYELLTADVPPA
jgi:hypothetical protein